MVLGTGAACRGGGGGGDPDAGVEDGGGSDGGTVEGWRWKACPLHTDDIWGKQAECAMIPVPLDWADPEGPSIEIFVKRLKTEGTSRGQLWLLQGGPGGSGAVYEVFQEQFAQIDGNWDTYAIDHRGVGKSARLGCPQEAATANKPFGLAPEDFEACLASLQAEWGEDLAHFNITNAAKDLEHLIAETRAPGEQVFLYGASYGTTWAHRYLQLDPEPIDGVILDSLAINIFFTDFDAYFNQVGEDFLALCTADTDCNTKVGGDAWGAVGLALDAIEAGSCSELGLDRKHARWFFAELLMNVATRDLIPAIAHRIQRCEAGDVAAIEQLRGVLAGFMPDYLRELDSRSLGLNIIASEFWPLYPTDAHHLQWAATDLPVLILQGDLDPQTPHWVA
ncbi:MAG: alpha/beta fold hydrolase [Deltaproteobacteria bacterium]|nr:alpha/beta fold hydrolase [Deltaproteobacteria bacterium]